MVRVDWLSPPISAKALPSGAATSTRWGVATGNSGATAPLCGSPATTQSAPPRRCAKTARTGSASHAEPNDSVASQRARSSPPAVATTSAPGAAATGRPGRRTNPKSAGSTRSSGPASTVTSETLSDARHEPAWGNVTSPCQTRPPSAPVIGGKVAPTAGPFGDAGSGRNVTTSARSLAGRPASACAAQSVATKLSVEAVPARGVPNALLATRSQPSGSARSRSAVAAREGEAGAAEAGAAPVAPGSAVCGGAPAGGPTISAAPNASAAMTATAVARTSGAREPAAPAPRRRRVARRHRSRISPRA